MRSLARPSYGGMVAAPTSRLPASNKNPVLPVMCLSAPGEVQLEAVVGKYVVAWLLGVPAFVLVIVYLIAH